VLPSVDRGRIFAVCAQVSLLVTALGFGLRAVAPAISPAVADGQAERVEALLQCEYPLPPSCILRLCLHLQSVLPHTLACPPPGTQGAL
jgi:hypothetical protein